MIKQKLYILYGFIHALKYPYELFLSFKYMYNQKILSDEEHIKLASDWLLFMQNDDGGYSRKFSLIKGRDKSYIETTGYIIPTLYTVGEILDKKKYINSALKAGEWLLRVQNEDGSFSDIDHNIPLAFDTGQVLIGLNFLYDKTKDKRYFQAAKKAIHWLCDNQEKDGSWKKVAYNRQKHTYYSRVSAAMMEFAVKNSDEKVKQKAYKNINWILSNQLENGFFKYASFLEDRPAFLHTIIYILEGLLDSYDLTKDEKILKAVLKNAQKLKDINLTRDMLLCSEYDKNYNCKNRQRCITGLAQWAGVCIRVYKITKDKDYLKIAKTTLFYLKSKQIQKGTNLKGSLPASLPFWGRYGAFDFVNWGVKFFLDALVGQRDVV